MSPYDDETVALPKGRLKEMTDSEGYEEAELSSLIDESHFGGGRGDDAETRVMLPPSSAGAVGGELEFGDELVTPRIPAPSSLQPAVRSEHPQRDAEPLSLALAKYAGAGVAALLAGLLLAVAVTEKPPAAPSANESVRLVSVPEPLVETSFVERLGAGQPEALKKFMSTHPSKRTVKDQLAYVEHQRSELREEKEQWVENRLANSASLSSEERHLLTEWVHDGAVADIALSFLARFPHEDGPDLLYSISQKKSTASAEVKSWARGLLFAPEVHSRHSRELRLAIEAEEKVGCDGARALLQRARDYGDRRSVRPMARFAILTGCGGDGSKDCYPCLRRNPLLERALNAAQLRPGP